MLVFCCDTPCLLIGDVDNALQDSPVGVGYSYSEDPAALVTTDLQATEDIVQLLRALTRKIRTLRRSPLFLVGESYGGKHAAMVGTAIARAIHARTINLTLGGVVLGDSWISPTDFAVSIQIDSCLLHALLSNRCSCTHVCMYTVVCSSRTRRCCTTCRGSTTTPSTIPTSACPQQLTFGNLSLQSPADVNLEISHHSFLGQNGSSVEGADAGGAVRHSAPDIYRSSRSDRLQE